MYFFSNAAQSAQPLNGFNECGMYQYMHIRKYVPDFVTVCLFKLISAGDGVSEYTTDVKSLHCRTRKPRDNSVLFTIIVLTAPGRVHGSCVNCIDKTGHCVAVAMCKLRVSTYLCRLTER